MRFVLCCAVLAATVSVGSAAEPVRYLLPNNDDGIVGAKVERADARTGMLELTAADPNADEPRPRGVEFEPPTIVEGRYLAIGLAKPREIVGSVLFAAEITEVLPKGRFRAKVDPSAVERFETVNMVVLFRPTGSTTAEMKAAPKVAPVVDKSKEIDGMGARMKAQLTASKNNLKQIAIALHNYHDTYRHFPPRALIGPDGKAWHSWRVLILPFLDQQDLYDRYEFDEPWDGPNNRKLHAEMPAVFRDPIHGEATKDGFTHYAAVLMDDDPRHLGVALRDAKFDGTAAGILKPTLRPTAFRDIMDGTSNTILAGSVSPAAKIHWLQPADVGLGEKFPGIGKKNGFAAPYEGKAGKAGVFAMCDGFVRTIRSDIDPDVLRSFLLRNDGKAVGDPPSLDPAQPGRFRRTRPVLEIHATEDGGHVAHFTQILDERPRNGATSRPGRGRPDIRAEDPESAEDSGSSEGSDGTSDDTGEDRE